MLSQTIFNTQEIDLTLTPEVSPGVPAPVDGEVQWEVVTGNSTFRIQDPGVGLTATLRSEDGIGVTRLRATGDADMGSGFVPISIEVELTVIGPQAQGFGGTFSPARDKQPVP